MTTGAGSATLWLDHAGPPSPVEAMILERAAGAARAVRAGIGPATAILDLPASCAAAKVGLRFSADGTDGTRAPGRCTPRNWVP